MDACESAPGCHPISRFMCLALSLENNQQADLWEWQVPPHCRRKWFSVQPAHMPPLPPLKMSANPRWRSSMSEVAEKCIRPWGGTYVYCIIDKDRRCWDLQLQEHSGLTESIFCLSCTPNPLFSLHLAPRHPPFPPYLFFFVFFLCRDTF